MADTDDVLPESDGGGSGRGPRSPNFPSIPLADAIGKARILYTKDRRSPASLQTVLTHLGFSQKLSGSTARVISALRQFGLIDSVGTGSSAKFRVTDLAYRIMALSEASPERVKAIQEAVKKPAIYRDILNVFPDGLPSDETLSDHLLMEKKFNETSVDTFIRVFKSSIEFAKLLPGAYTETPAATLQPNGHDEDLPVPQPTNLEPSAKAQQTSTLIPPMTWVLSIPRAVRAELRIIGLDVRKDDLVRLKQQIDFLVASFTDESDEPPKQN